MAWEVCALQQADGGNFKGTECDIDKDGKTSETCDPAVKFQTSPSPEFASVIQRPSQHTRIIFHNKCNLSSLVLFCKLSNS